MRIIIHFRLRTVVRPVAVRPSHWWKGHQQHIVLRCGQGCEFFAAVKCFVHFGDIRQVSFGHVKRGQVITIKKHVIHIRNLRRVKIGYVKCSQFIAIEEHTIHILDIRRVKIGYVDCGQVNAIVKHVTHTFRDGRGINCSLVYRCHNALVSEHLAQSCYHQIFRLIPSSFAGGVRCYRILGASITGTIDVYGKFASRRPLYVLAAAPGRAAHQSPSHIADVMLDGGAERLPARRAVLHRHLVCLARLDDRRLAVRPFEVRRERHGKPGLAVELDDALRTGPHV